MRPTQRAALMLLALVLVAAGAARVHRLGGAPVRAAGAPVAVPAPPATLDVNLATADELTSLPGIGPVLARRIVDHRARKGPFARVDDLLGVRGIGPRLLARVRGRLEAPAR